MTKESWVVFIEPKGNNFELIREAAEQGFKSILFTSTPVKVFPAPYVGYEQYIDEMVTVSHDWASVHTGLDLILRTLGGREVAGTYTAVEAGVVVNAALRKKLGLNGPDVSLLKTLTHKLETRKLLRSLNLSQLECYPVEDIEPGTWPLKGAGFLKQVRGGGSVSVARVHNYADMVAKLGEFNDTAALAKHVPAWLLAYMRGDYKFYLEQDWPGELISVEGISTDRYIPLGITSRAMSQENEVMELGHGFPYMHPLHDKIIAYVEEVHRKLGVKYMPTHTEVIVDKNGRIEIIDFNPRLAGAEIFYQIEGSLNHSFRKILLDLALGRTDSINKLNLKVIGASYLQYIMPPREISTFESISYPDDGSVNYYRTFKSNGDTITDYDTQLGALSCFISKGDTFDEAVRQALQARDKIRINETFKGRFD